MSKFSGKCLCGEIAYEINGDIGAIYNCHCSKCRRWHGSAFRTRASVKSIDFRWLRGEELLSKFHSSDNTIKTFCSICGSNLISTYDNDPEYIGLPLSGLEQALDHQAKGHIFVGSKSPWYEITDDLPQYDSWPGDEDVVRGQK